MVVFLLNPIHNKLLSINAQKGEEKKMKEKEWKEFVATVHGWTDGTDELATASAVLSIIAAGDEDKTTREGGVLAVKAMMKGKDNNPFGRGVKKRILTFEQENNLNEILSPLFVGLVAAFNSCEHSHKLIVPYGRSKLKAFDTADQFAESIVSRARAKAIELVKAEEFSL